MRPSPLRILLISPKGPLYRHRGGIFGKGLRYMPLTFPTLAALIPDDVHATVTCIDEGIEDLNLQQDADLVGLTVLTGTAPRAYSIAATFRERGIPVVLGGPHITLAPDDAAPHADAIVVGYAEESWPRLLRDVAQDRLQPRYDQIPDLDLAGMPPPDRSVLRRRSYLTSHVFEATRGCIHDCDFCVVPSAWGRKPLQQPVQQVIDDLKRQRTRRAVFIDLNLIADRSYALALFRAMTPLRLQWYGLATTLLARDQELLDAAADSGCRGLLMGFESISDRSLRQSKKSFNHPDQYDTIVQRLHERRIALQGCFVFGFDNDDEDVPLATARRAVELGIDLPRFAILTPFPGTKLFHRFEAEGRILTRNWELYDGQHVVHRPLGMSIDALQTGTERAWRHAYSWPNIARRLRHGAAPWPVALVTNIGYRRYANNLHRFYSCDAMFALPLASRQQRVTPLTVERSSA